MSLDLKKARERLADLELQRRIALAELNQVRQRLGELRVVSKELDHLRSRNRQLWRELDDLERMIQLYRQLGLR